MKNSKLFIVIFLAFSSLSLSANESLSKEALGQILFFDKNLSNNRTQSCATCHNPNNGFVDNRENGVSKMASMGDNNKSIGDREAPTASYARFSPAFHFDEKKQKYIGGQFWDGRAATLEDQAGGPPLNPDEMGMASKKEVISRIKENELYVSSFKNLYGNDILENEEKAYVALTQVIALFERTDEFSPFDSKYDRYLKGEYDLTALEDLGKSLFFSNNNNSCSSCHVLKGEDKEGETFTNYEFHNIGVPANQTLRDINGVKNIDKGLLNNPAVHDEKEKGKYKVPTLRNVAVTAPYMHNGVFADLKTVVEFYDKYNNKDRTINPETKKAWDEAEVKDTISTKELKAKALNDRKIEALLAFMKLLTDKKYEYLLAK
jgi:cytochrome c peroxidase